MAVNRQNGSALLFLFIAVGLFAAISYAFMQGSRNNLTMITSEKAKATATGSQDCTNAVNMATKRLTMRGCSVAQISSDVTGGVGAGPTDGSCAIYHPNGGGVKSCGYVVPSVDCATAAIGTTCGNDAVIYIGTLGAGRVYLAPADEPGMYAFKTSNTSTAGTGSWSNGLANTTAMVAAGIASHPAAQACTSKSPPGTWYLPAPYEARLIQDNRISEGGPLDITSSGLNVADTLYQSSMHPSATIAGQWLIESGGSMSINLIGINAKTSLAKVRCVRN